MMQQQQQQQPSLSEASSATEALEQLQNSKPVHVISKSNPMISTKTLKRSRAGLHCFDMASFEKASEQVKESIEFPSIEWSFDDCNDEEEEFSLPSPPKRRCGGLIRSSPAILDLASFSERRARRGSLC